jgi:capsular exopolysaccharide synthesis family protein
MHLRNLREARNLKTVLISSPVSEDGKSTIALNLATALAEEGKHRVLLLEADLHHAPLVSQLGLVQGGGGLVDCLERNVDPPTVIRRLDPLGWCLLPAGEVHSNPTDLLQTTAYASVIKTLSDHFDWILVDSPPVVALTDALFLRQHADGVLLVVRAGHTPQEAVEDAVRQLGGQHVLAVVLNAVEGLDRLYYKYGGTYPGKGKSPKTPV